MTWPSTTAVPAFVAHLELLREAGSDPAVAEAELDEDAVHVLTVHKAKGLEFRVVFLVGCAESKFPLQRRGDALGLPEPLVKEELTGGASGHMLEERRLFYVAMTRAMDELLLTSVADYGTARARKLSRFVVEALDLPSPKPLSRRTAPLEALAREAPAPQPVAPVEGEIPEDELLRLSYGQIDDYETCPLKYRYLHVLRVPLLAHHAMVYGHAVHEAVRSHFETLNVALNSPAIAGEFTEDLDALLAEIRKSEPELFDTLLLEELASNALRERPRPTPDQEKTIGEFQKARMEENRAFREEMRKFREEMRGLARDP